MLRSHHDEDFRKDTAALKKIHDHSLVGYKFGLVMPEADRSLQDIYLNERPSWLQVRDFAQVCKRLVSWVHESSHAR